MATDNNTQLLLLEQKRNALFECLQDIFDISKDIHSDVQARENFLGASSNIETLRSEYILVLDAYNKQLLITDPKATPNYKPLISFENVYSRVKRLVTQYAPQNICFSNKDETHAVPRKSRLTLPPIELVAFDGDIKSWPLFYASYKSTVHDNPSLTDAEKVYYLLGKLTGKARSVCAGITPSGENYQLLFQTLINKYEDKRLLATSYLDQIFDIKNISSANANSLEQFLDKFASSVAALKNLKISNLTDFILLYIALKKIDNETARSFELDKRGEDIPSFDDLMSFIRDHIKILQRTSSSKPEATKKNLERKLDIPYKSTHSYVNTTPASSQSVCSLCHARHDYLYKCSSFQSLSPSDRYKYVKSNNLCINCLSDKHRSFECKSNSRCQKCQRKHHSMLHFINNPSSIGSSNCGSASPASSAPQSSTATKAVDGPRASSSSPATARSDNVTLCTLSNNKSPVLPTTVLLATARVIVLDSQGNEHYVRALLDSASQSNFITRECCQRLGLNANSRLSVVKGIGGSSRNIEGSVHIKFFSRLDQNVCFEMESLIIDKVTERLPVVSIDTSTFSYFKNLLLADDTYHTPGEIDMLVGASIFPHLLLSHKVKGNLTHGSACALNTVLGYVIVGSAPARFEDNTTVSYCCAAESLDSIVRKFWEVEEVNVPSVSSADDKTCEEIYNRTTTRNEDGRYTVALPFKGDIYSLGDSLPMAKRRFLCLERKMLASPKLKEAYDSVIREYLDKGFISYVDLDTNLPRGEPSYIIPHHGVIREDKLTSKLRVVLDGSAKTSTNVSLNDILYNGQNLQGNLFNIIVNFRLFNIALSADIRQMFLCIGIREEDRRFQRILYRFSPQEPLKVYEFNRVCFGLKSSPFHALRTMKQLAADEGANYPKAKETVERGLYMDDFVYCVDTEEEAMATAAQVISLMKAGQFDLVKWTSNSSKVLDSIPPSHRLSSVKEFDDTDTHKVLGLCWSPTSDLFSLKISLSSETCTKRTILSCVARIWDVMGFVAPVVLYAKLLIKELWLCECDWDDPPPDDIVRSWARFTGELHLLSQIKIPRHVGITRGSVITLVGFADASEKAYGGVVYLHVKNSDETSSNLLCAKSKVSPRKVISLARLELCALFVLAKLISTVVAACNNRIIINNIFAFSDSTVALCWVHSSPHRWDTFVANRVTKIQNELAPQHFYHVSGKENPADCLSRGLTPAQIINHPLWFTGPSWAQGHIVQWPAFNPSAIPHPPEEKKHTMVTSTQREESPIISLSQRLSSWSKLLRCIVFVCRFAKLLPSRDKITASDYEYAELLLLRELQKLYFHKEIANLQSNKPCSTKLRRLKPFLHNGLIRVGGRLINSDLSFDQMHPIVLPRKDHILNLLVEYYHKLHCHAGPDLLMSLLRQRYWILSARNLIRSRVHKCIPCFRLKPKSTFPEMADHRTCRVVKTAKPFVHTGTDYAGPFKITMSRGRGIRSIKAYVCLFVCLTTRAVHIELAGDLSTASFMGVFKRFLSRRGPVSRIYSDNGTNFIGAKRLLSELHAFLISKHFNTEFAHMLAENRIEWSLNVPAASHFGGNWETNIKSLKTHLYRVIGDQILSFEELSTVLAQIEAVMNTRPLCRILSSDPSEPLALTPAHFLNVTPLKFLPAKEIDEDRLHITSRYQLLDKLVQSFWKRWKSNYLHTLQSRNKWNTPSNPIAVGTVVILISENTPPLHWPLGIIEETFPGSNGVTRIVRVKTNTGSYLRPVVRLCPLPNQ